MPRARTLVAALAAALALAAPALAHAGGGRGDSAHGQSTIVSPDPPLPGSVPQPVIGGPPPRKPAYFELTGREAIAIADRDPKVADTARHYGRLKAYAEVKEPDTWQVGYYSGDAEVVQVLVDDPSATVRESWTGYQVAWQMARGYPGQFGHLLNSPWVWGGLAAVFLLGLFDFRRPWRIAHLDLLVLLSFGASEAYFNAANIGVSVPLAYPPLLYLLARMLWVGFRGLRGGLRPTVPAWVLTIALFFLIGFRIALNVADSGVIDVGYAGTIGADKITHGQPIYGDFPEDNSYGDTYGPANYYAYVPFELAFPWHGSWDDLPSAHAAAIFFDLAAMLGLFVLGRVIVRRRADGEPPPGDRRAVGRAGNALGVTLAFAWAAYPFTDYALQSNSNDSLVGALLVWAFVAFASPVGRGVLLALAAMVKFAPLGLVPLFAAGERGLAARHEGARGALNARLRPRLRPLALFAFAFVAVTALMLAHPAIDPGLGDFYDRTLKSQLDRTSPFSVWGQEQGLEWLQTVVRVLAVALAVVVAFLPRRRTLPQLAALAAAVLIAAQLGVDHWFYLYLPWFAGLTFAALAAPGTRAVAMASAPPAAIRIARPGDGAAMSRVFAASGRAAGWDFLPQERIERPPERWEADIADPDAVAFVAERDGALVGFAVVRPSRDADADPATGELDTFYTAPEVWGAGVGRLLIDEAAAELRALGYARATLWTAERNLRSQRFYAADGWQPDGATRLKNFAGVEFTELRFSKELDSRLRG